MRDFLKNLFTFLYSGVGVDVGCRGGRETSARAVVGERKYLAKNRETMRGFFLFYRFGEK